MSEVWPEARDVLILVDFSAIAYACWMPAEAAEKAGKEALEEHLASCPVCVSTDTCADLPKQYDAHEVLKTNLRLKMGTIEEHTGEPPRTYVMVCDSHAKWKFDLFPNYKGDRAQRFNPRPEAEAFLRECYPTMQWVVSPGNEADDAIAALVKANRGQRAIVIVSGDKDLHQLWGPGVKIFSPVTKKFLDLETIQKKFYGLGPECIRACKSFWGDTSDSVPNVAPHQQRQLIPLIKEAGGDLLKMTNLQKKVSSTCWQHLQKNYKQILINWQLVGLNPDVDLEWK